MGSCRARSVYLTILLLGRLRHPSGKPVLCLSFCQKLTTALLESAGGRMTVENISWSISTKECCRPAGFESSNSWLSVGRASNWGRLFLLSLHHSEGLFFFFLLAWRFSLNENILFWLTLSYMYQKPFVFSASMLCFQIFLILNLRPKIGLTYAISIVKWYFLYFCLSKYFYFSLLNLNYWCFTTILWNFSENIEQVELVENLPQITYPTGFCIIFIHFYYGKKWKYLMF